jgi:hypothetical protein
MFAVYIKMANLRECIKLPVVDIIFLAVYRWSKAIEYFLRIVLLNTFRRLLNVFAKTLNIFRSLLNIKRFIEYFKSVLNIKCCVLNINCVY